MVRSLCWVAKVQPELTEFNLEFISFNMSQVSQIFYSELY